MRKHEGNNICAKCYDLIYRPRVNIDSMIKLKIYTSLVKMNLIVKIFKHLLFTYIYFVPPIRKNMFIMLFVTHVYFIKCYNVSITMKLRN